MRGRQLLHFIVEDGPEHYCMAAPFGTVCQIYPSIIHFIFGAKRGGATASFYQNIFLAAAAHA